MIGIVYWIHKYKYVQSEIKIEDWKDKHPTIALDDCQISEKKYADLYTILEVIVSS